MGTLKTVCRLKQTILRLTFLPNPNLHHTNRTGNIYTDGEPAMSPYTDRPSTFGQDESTSSVIEKSVWE